MSLTRWICRRLPSGRLVAVCGRRSRWTFTGAWPNDLAQALREEKRTDRSGREYRAYIPVRMPAKDGLPLFEWADIDEAPRSHVEKSVQQRKALHS